MRQYAARRDAAQRFAQALGRPSSIPGPTQAQWWKDTISQSTATWKVWGNEVRLNRLWADLTQLAPAPYDAVCVVNCDSWDGYPSHKAKLMGFLGATELLQVLAGRRREQAVVRAGGEPGDVRGPGRRQQSGDLKYHDHDAQGYATATVTAAQLVVTFTKVKPLNTVGTAPASPLLKRMHMKLTAGSLVPMITDDV